MLFLSILKLGDTPHFLVDFKVNKQLNGFANFSFERCAIISLPWLLSMLPGELLVLLKTKPSCGHPVTHHIRLKDT